MGYIITQIFMFIMAISLMYLGMFGYIENSWINVVGIIAFIFSGMAFGNASNKYFIEKSIFSNSAKNTDSLEMLINYAKERTKNKVAK